MTNIVLAYCILHNMLHDVENDQSLVDETDHELMDQDVDVVEDGCCPFKIVFDEGLYVVFDEDLYVHYFCILLCFKYVLGGA